MLMRLSVTSDLWWKNAIVYCVDVETFADGNGDGIGDLPGLTERIDYLAGLGVTCLWLLPIYPSPRRDDGYDITDFYGIDPRFGTIGDFVELVRTAGDRGIKVLVDLVLNHTSDQHPWFQDARSNPDSPYRDWYVWSDEKPADTKTGIAFPDKEKSTWTYDRKAHAFYFHHFYRFQPDLDIDNQAVRDEQERIVGFWLELGVAGFRCDAIPFYLDVDGQKPSTGDPHVHLRRLRGYLSRRRGDAIMLGEVNVPSKDLPSYFGGDDGDELHMSFAFPVMQAIWLSLARQHAAPLIHALDDLPALPETGQVAQFLRNHDELTLDQLTASEVAEVFAVFAPDEQMRLYGHGIRRRLAPLLGGDPAKLRCVQSLLFSLPGTPTLFYGDEYGLGDNLDLPDRLAVRTPMQWSPRRNGGFSTAEDADLVRPVRPDGPYGYRRCNVSAQRRDPESLLNWTERLVRTRRETPEIGWGVFSRLTTAAPSVLAHRLDWQSSTLVAVHNLSDAPAEVELQVDGLGGDAECEEVLSDQSSYPPLQARQRLTLPPWGYRWVRVHRPGRAP
jgi:maltose alpha-D-glucosyltransferase/alpha-amylase